MVIDGSLPWTVRTGSREELGISGRVLRGPAFTRVRRGVYVPAGADPQAPDNRIAAVVADLPSHAAVGLGQPGGRVAGTPSRGLPPGSTTSVGPCVDPHALVTAGLERR